MITQRQKIIFISGTRADFGKLKSLMLRLQADESFEVHVFVTGMHMLSKYGYTCTEVEASGFDNIYKYINQSGVDSMDQILAKTIAGLSDYVKEIVPNLIIVHGDRVEALAGASVGALNNILVGHIEGGEVSGTIDELIRHAVTKLSHIHFVANKLAKKRISQLGELQETVHIIGSPDIDVMNSDKLPDIVEVKKRYTFEFDEYSILMFHPVTSELKKLKNDIKLLVDKVIESKLNFIVIYPNNDHGTNIILEEYARFDNHANIKVYPSMRFEFFLSLLKQASLIIGNSSAGVREAPHFGVPAINLGSRQKNRVKCLSVLDTEIADLDIAKSIFDSQSVERKSESIFGYGNSAELFHKILKTPEFWLQNTQKHFVDRELK